MLRTGGGSGKSCDWDGASVGFTVGLGEGAGVGPGLGCGDGLSVGGCVERYTNCNSYEILVLGLCVGVSVGVEVGFTVGRLVGNSVGFTVGTSVGDKVGPKVERCLVGDKVGGCVCCSVGLCDRPRTVARPSGTPSRNVGGN